MSGYVSDMSACVTRDSVVTLRGVEVKGSRGQKIKSSAPTFGLSSLEMTKQGVTGLSDALRRMPGLTIRDYGGAGGLMTVSIRGLGAAHTTVVYDGVALTDARGGEVDLSRYSLDNVSGLSLTIGDNEEIFLPARVVSSAGSLSIRSNGLDPFQPKGDAKVTAILKGGSFGMVSPFLRVSKNVTDRVAVGFMGEYLHADNDYPFTLVNGGLVTRERRNSSRMNSYHLEGDAAVRTGERSTLTSKVYWYDNARRLPGAVVYYNDINHERLHDRNFFIQSALRSVLSPNLSLLATGKLNWSSSLYHDENGKYQGGVLDQNYYQREAYGSGALLWMPAKGIGVDYSADYFFNNLSSNLETDVRPYRHSILQSLTGRYSTERLTLTVRGIASIYLNDARRGKSGNDYRKLSPSASVSLRLLPEKDLYARLSYKSIFRMPTFNEYYFDHLGNPDLRPETTNQFNVGLTFNLPAWGCMSNMSITADGYINNVKDKIVAIPFNMFIWQMLNLEKVRSRGGDFTLNSTFTAARNHQIILSGNYSYQRSEPLSKKGASDYKKQVAYTPRHSGAASVCYENPFVNFVFHGTGVSERYTTNANLPATRINGYMDFGAAVYRSFNFNGWKLEARFDVINIFDEQYEIVARYPMPGRSWRMSVKFDF